MPRWMPYFKLLNKVYRIKGVLFQSRKCPKTWGHVLQSSLFCAKIGKIIASKILFARNRDNFWDLFVFKTSKGVKGLFFQLIKCHWNVTCWRNKCARGDREREGNAGGKVFFSHLISAGKCGTQRTALYCEILMISSLKPSWWSLF